MSSGPAVGSAVIPPYWSLGVIPPVPHVALCGPGMRRHMHLHCSTDGRRVVYGCEGGVVVRLLPDQIEDLLTERVVEIFGGSRRAITMAAISPNGAFVAGGDDSGTVYIWNRIQAAPCIPHSKTSPPTGSGPPAGGSGSVSQSPSTAAQPATVTSTMKSYELGMRYVRIADMSFSADSKILAICGIDRYAKRCAACIFVDGGFSAGSIEGHTLGGVQSICIRGDKKPNLIASVGSDGMLALHTGPPFRLAVRGFPAGSDAPLPTAAPNGRGASMSRGASTSIQTLGCGTSQSLAHCIRFSPDGLRLLGSTESGKLICWDSTSGAVDHEIDLGLSVPIVSFDWAASNTTVVIVSTDRIARIIDITSLSILDQICLGNRTDDTPIGVCWTATEWVCILTRNGHIHGFKTENWERFLPKSYFLWQGTVGALTAAAIDPLSGRILIGDSLSMILLLRTKEAEPQPFHTLQLPNGITIRSVVLANKLGAAVTSDGTIRAFQLPSTDQQLGLQPPSRQPGTAQTLHLAGNSSIPLPSSKTATFVRSVSSFVDGVSDLRSSGTAQVSKAQPVSFLAAHNFRDTPMRAVLANDGKVILVFCSNGRVHAYPFLSVQSQFEPLWSTQLHGTLTAVSASADGSLIALAVTVTGESTPNTEGVLYPLEKFGDNRSTLTFPLHLIEFYEYDDDVPGPHAFRFVCVHEYHKAEISAVALNPSGTLLASADLQRCIHVLEVETGRMLVKESDWHYHTARISCLHWSPDGTKLASGSLDKGIYVWNINDTKKYIHIKDAHPGGVTHALFIFNNMLLFSGNEGSISIVELAPDESHRPAQYRLS